jgi:hypothetical protein
MKTTPKFVKKPLTLGGIRIPAELETLHWLFAGTTGTGKTTAIEELLDGIVERSERAIICDPNGSYLSRFGVEGDRLLNPFDHRSEKWKLFSEIHRDYDADRLARSVVPDGHGDAAAWNGYAQTLLAELLRTLIRSGDTTTEQLLYWATIASPEELGKRLAGTPAAGLFDSDASKALASTRYVLAAHLAPQRHLMEGGFSLRDWLETDTGSLYLTWRTDMQTALAPLLATWVDVLASAILSLAPSQERRIWLIIDELAAIGKLSSLEPALTMGRKNGLCIVAGLQSTAQLDRIYGKDSAQVLRACFRNILVLAIAKTDPETSEALSRSLGDREVRYEEESRSMGAGGNTRNVSVRQVNERVVMPAEIAALPNLVGYLALAGDLPIQKIKLVPKFRELSTAAYEEDQPC